MNKTTWFWLAAFLCACAAETVDCEEPSDDPEAQEAEAAACDRDATELDAQLGNNRGNQGRNHSH